MTSLDNTKPIKSRFNSNAEKNNLDRPTRTFLKKEDTQGRSKALIQKTKQHYQRHAKKWNDKEYMRLKNKEGITLEHPKPKRSQSIQNQRGVMDLVEMNNCALKPKRMFFIKKIHKGFSE